MATCAAAASRAGPGSSSDTTQSDAATESFSNQSSKTGISDRRKLSSVDILAAHDTAFFGILVEQSDRYLINKAATLLIGDDLLKLAFRHHPLHPYQVDVCEASKAIANSLVKQRAVIREKLMYSLNCLSW
ncbi:hypothetical protein BH23VER1_BH23VER1_13690 [soil metagenome]